MTKHVLVYEITDLHCGDCAELIDETVRALPGVLGACTEMSTRHSTVAIDADRADEAAVVEAIESLGFRTARPFPGVERREHAGLPGSYRYPLSVNYVTTYDRASLSRSS